MPVPPGSTRFRGVYDAAARPNECVQEYPWPTTDRLAIPARPFPPPSPQSRAPRTWTPPSRRSSTAADEALAPSMGAVVLADPDRAGLQLAAAHGLDDAGRIALAAEMTDPTHPFSEATAGRSATFDRQATLASGDAFIGAYLPCSSRVEASRSRSVRSASGGRLRTSWPMRTGRCSRRSPGWRPSPSIERGWRPPPRSAPSGSSGWPITTR